MCPYCEKEVDLSYGCNIPCPECGERVNVFDDTQPIEGQLANGGYRIRFLGQNKDQTDDWVKQHIIKRDRPKNSASSSVSPLDKQVISRQIEDARELLRELHQAEAEGIPVSRRELERLNKYLEEFEEPEVK